MLPPAAAASTTATASISVPPSPAAPSLPRRPSFSSFTLLSALRSLHLPAAQWLLERGASLAAEEAEEGRHLLDAVWEMVRDDRDSVGGGNRSWTDFTEPQPPPLRRASSSQSANASARSRVTDDGPAVKRLTVDRRKSTPLPAGADNHSAAAANTATTARATPRLPSSDNTYLALSPLASVDSYRGPVPFSSALSSLLLLLLPHSAALQLPALPSSPPPSLSTVHSLATFYSHLYPLLLTLHSNTASLALTHAHILDDINHTLAALAAQQQQEQQREEDDEDGKEGTTAAQGKAAAQHRWRQKKDELARENQASEQELMEYLRERAADVEAEALWAAERVQQQLERAANEERRVTAEVKSQRRLQRRISSMEQRYTDTQRLSAESSERCQLLAQQTSAFSMQLSLVSAALSAERAKSAQDEADLVAVRMSQQQYCMLAFRPRAHLFRKPLLRDPHPQLRLVLPPSLCLQSSEVVRHSQSPSWADWRVQLSAVGGSSARWRLEVWDVDEGSSGRRAEERLCGCWSSVSDVLLAAGEDVELQLLSGESTSDGEHVGMLWLSAVRMAYV